MILEAFLRTRLAEWLAGKSRTNDVHLGDIINDISNVSVDGKTSWLTPVFLINFGSVGVNVRCEYAFMAQPMEGGMKSPDSTKQVYESHRNDFLSAVIKLNGEVYCWSYGVSLIGLHHSFQLSTLLLKYRIIIEELRDHM